MSYINLAVSSIYGLCGGIIGLCVYPIISTVYVAVLSCTWTQLHHDSVYDSDLLHL